MRLSPDSLRTRPSRSRQTVDGAVPTVADVDWSQFDFVDLGCSKGGSLSWCQGRFGSRRGLGLDLDPRKVEQTIDAGLDAVLADATRIDAQNVVRFVSMMDFLEHLPGLEVVEAALERSAKVATDFLFIRHPSFEGEGLVEQLGVRQYWWHWSGHTVHPQVADFCGMLERLGLNQYSIRYRDPVRDSSHPSVLPLDTPKNQHDFDPDAHPRKPGVEFPRPLWRSQDILVALRSFEASEWAALVAAVDG